MASFIESRPAFPGTDKATRRAGAVIAIGLHLVAVGALLSYAPARNALIAAAPIMVEFLTPPKPVEIKPPPPVELPKPKPVAKKAVLPPKPAPTPPPQSIVASPTPAPAPVEIAAPSPAPSTPVQAPVAAAPAASPGPVATTPPIFNADYLENPAPAYPPVSRKMREEGRVLLRVLVNSKGTADEVQVRTTSGISRLDEAAVETVKRWRFVPAKRGGDAVSAWVLIPISFKLET